LYGDVDVEPEVMDEQGADPRQAPIDLGYWIEGPLPDSEQFDDVKGEVHPYRLYDFRVEYFGGIPTTSPKTPPAPCDAVADIADDANAGCRGLANCFDEPNVSIDTCNSVVTEGFAFWVFPILHHFIVTHAKGETGRARTSIETSSGAPPPRTTASRRARRTPTTRAARPHESLGGALPRR
jgi:hypothetical protein